MLRASFVLVLLFVAAAAQAQPPASKAADAKPRAPADQPAPEAQVKALSGMSVLGNQEAPKSLVIVPWKSSEIGNGIGVSKALETRIRPVDKDVFLRELHYYELRSAGTK